MKTTALVSCFSQLLYNEEIILCPAADDHVGTIPN